MAGLCQNVSGKEMLALKTWKSCICLETEFEVLMESPNGGDW